MAKYKNGNTSILPKLWIFIASSIASIILYYIDMITDFLILVRIYKKMIDSNERQQRRVYEFFFYACLTFTIVPILSLILINILKANWKYQSGIKFLSKLASIFIGSIFNFGLVK
jgi:ABC-type multidrug transport system permease subunit